MVEYSIHSACQAKISNLIKKYNVLDWSNFFVFMGDNWEILPTFTLHSLLLSHDILKIIYCIIQSYRYLCEAPKNPVLQCVYGM